MLLLLVLVAGLWAGLQNTLAGGGSFITLPALIVSGMSPLAANITSTVALFPGQVTSGLAGRSLVSGVGKLSFRALFMLSLVGGAVGGWLLLHTPPTVFARLVPWLVLFATGVFAWGSFRRKPLEGHAHIGPRTAALAQFLIGIYGGYFGGGVGLITTALYGLLANIRPRELFAIRTTMLAVANFAAALVFIGFAMVSWWECLPMLLGSIAGGWLGALIGKRLTPGLVRTWTLLVTGATTILFFVRAYAG